MRSTRLYDKMKVVLAVVPYAGGAGAMTPVEVAGAGFSRAMFIIQTGAATATGKLDAKIQKSATTGGALSDVTDAVLTQVDDTGGSKVYIIDVKIDPAKPFMKVTGSTSTAAVANACVCVLYRGVNTVASTYATQLVDAG